MSLAMAPPNLAHSGLMFLPAASFLLRGNLAGGVHSAARLFFSFARKGLVRGAERHPQRQKAKKLPHLQEVKQRPFRVGSCAQIWISAYSAHPLHQSRNHPIAHCSDRLKVGSSLHLGHGARAALATLNPSPFQPAPSFAPLVDEVKP